MIEFFLNSRPISPISTCGEDVEALTLGHFLIGSTLTVSAEPFDETNDQSYRLLEVENAHSYAQPFLEKVAHKKYLSQL